MRTLLAACCIASFLIAGCSSFTSPISEKIAEQAAQQAAEIPQWTGRISVQVHLDPLQSFFAGFELQGNVHTGMLRLHSPLGNTLATLRWTPQEALLDTGTQVQSFASMHELTQAATGAALPLAALFDWLVGIPTELEGWQADLTQRAQGRISARRVQPNPICELRVVLNSP